MVAADMVISANAFIIFLGGFETTSSTLAFLLLELAAHPHVQDKMREEVLKVLDKHEGKVSYEMLQKLTYMEMVIQETLRLYPPFPSIQRVCTRAYVVPATRVLVRPGTVALFPTLAIQRDGQGQSSVLVRAGTVVLFPTLAIQRDGQYFDNPDAFVPERWGQGRPAPPAGVYMPFGDGPRYCIGKRFAMIQMKTCLARLLPLVRVSPAPRAPPRARPFPADPRSPLTLHPADSTVTISLL
ncbi:unnamed protein product [Plutella xylostella]|uniref:unspecific monooxygenase n=1 Tax=Plutella xylostella TaxID=51655 RepID=A0A8S4G2I4_PLUXY|nr:unnamed protein product [Plutella xylostella]